MKRRGKKGEGILPPSFLFFSHDDLHRLQASQFLFYLKKIFSLVELGRRKLPSSYVNISQARPLAVRDQSRQVAVPLLLQK